MKKFAFILVTLLSFITLTSLGQNKIVRFVLNENSIEPVDAVKDCTTTTNMPNSTITNSVILRTVIYNNNDNLPLVGGVITTRSSNIVAKLVIVSINKNDLFVRDNYPLTDPYNYAVTENNKWGISVNIPSAYRIIDCTNVNREQFFCYLKALQPNMTYYVRSAIVKTDSSIEYGNVESVKTPNNFKRMNGTLDYANVWNSQWKYTVLDLVTDEIVDIRKGLVYSSNEEPTPKFLENPIGKWWSTCYKFANEWNYVLWLSHAKNLVFEQEIVDEPIITQKGEFIEMICNENEEIHYEVNQKGITRPQYFSATYTQPFRANKGDIIKAYAKNKTSNFPSYTNVFVVQ